MKTTSSPEPVRLSGRAGMLAAIPVVLGFVPTESLVVACLAGRRHRLGPTARVDLPPGGDAGLARSLATRLGRHADSVVLVCYSDADTRPPLLDQMIAEMRRAGVAVDDVLRVSRGLVRSAWDAAEESADPGKPVPGRDDPQVVAITAAAAWRGRAVLADRDSLRGSIAAPSGATARRATELLDRAAGRLVRLAESGADGTTQPQLRRRAEQVIDRAVAEVRRFGWPQPTTSAELTLLAVDITIRDLLIAHAVEGAAEVWLPLLIRTARRTPTDLAAGVCAVLAVAAYRFGEGALAQVAIDRVLAAEPGNRLAHLMLGAMAAAMPPDELARLTGPQRTSQAG